jgi:hypothetical protein
MPPKRSKKSPTKPDPNRISTRPKNADAHPGQVVHSQSTRRPVSEIQAEKDAKAARRSKKELELIKQDETAEAIAEYEQEMVINHEVEDAQFPRHLGKAGMSYFLLYLLISYYYYAHLFIDRGNPSGPMKRPNAGQSTSGTKIKIKDTSNQSFEIVDNGPEEDSSVEEQPKSKRTRIVPDDAQTAGKVNILKRK